MKIIISRKGFDSSAGGFPSPILDDGTLVPLFIPEKKSRIRYSDITVHGHGLGPLVEDLTRGQVKNCWGAHLDPDLVRDTCAERAAGWRPAFGQAEAAQGVLAKAGVGPGDLFLYFGWFRRAERTDGGYRYMQGAPDLHVLWGWLQTGDVFDMRVPDAPDWLSYHPHWDRPEWTRNAVYVASEGLSLQGHALALPGAGIFTRYSEDLCLTAKGETRRVWRLPGWFRPSPGRPALGYHGKAEGWLPDGDKVLLTTVRRGQEFVLDADSYPDAIPWAGRILEDHGRPLLQD